MADSVAQVYMIGVMCIMAFFAVSCLIGVGKAKNEKNRKTRNRILKKAGERYGTYINLYNFEHYYCCRSNLGDYRILSISSGSKNE